jgi:acyl CoA:acetate/3-ketoacid CoA transferase beta subunit
VKRCSFPLTAKGVVQRVYTDLAILAPAGERLEVVELLADISLRELQFLTEAPLHAGPGVL